MPTRQTIIIVTLAMVLCVGTSQVQAEIDWDFYEDGTIGLGDEYNIVNIYDSLEDPPVHTTVNMTGGEVYFIYQHDTSTLSISGGTVFAGVITHDTSSANISDGNIDYITTYDTSTLSVTGGTTSVQAAGYSTADVSGGNISGATAYGYGTINFFGTADSWFLRTVDSGIGNMNGGTVENIGSAGSSTINLYGGVISDYIAAYDSSIINIFGYDLAKTSSGGSYGYGQVSGFFMDDSAFTIDLAIAETYSHINLVPEPSTLILLGLGALIMKKKFER